MTGEARNDDSFSVLTLSSEAKTYMVRLWELEYLGFLASNEIVVSPADVRALAQKRAISEIMIAAQYKHND